MKRSPLRRKTPLGQGAPLKRTPMKRTSTKRRHARAANDEQWRSETYIDWIKSLPCCRCGGPGGDPHHVIGLHWGLSGMGMTAPDSFVMPLCRPHHNAVHQRPELQRLQPDWLRWTLARGIRYFDGEIREALVEAWHTINDKEAA